MPITAERHKTALLLAQKYLNLYSELRTLISTASNANLLHSAELVIERTLDPAAREIIARLTSELRILESHLSDNPITLPEAVLISVELKHFNQNAKKLENSKYRNALRRQNYQAQRSQERNYTPASGEDDDEVIYSSRPSDAELAANIAIKVGRKIF